MNRLLSEIRFSLLELQKGLNGQLNMSEAMEDLAEALSINQVPGRNIFHKASWEKLAWPSKKSLQSWFADLLVRVDQLQNWSAELVLPYSLWLPGLFNPMAFLTAIMQVCCCTTLRAFLPHRMAHTKPFRCCFVWALLVWLLQVTSRQTGLPLDKMTIATSITVYTKPDQATFYPENGAFVHGMFIEGARWATGDDAGETVTIGGAPCAGHLTESRLKELLPPLPVMYVRAVPVEDTWEPTSVGYLRHQSGEYRCCSFLAAVSSSLHVAPLAPFLSQICLNALCTPPHSVAQHTFSLRL